VDLFFIGRHLTNAPAVQYGDIGTEAAGDAGGVHRHITAADDGDFFADTRVASVGHIGQSLQSGQDARMIFTVDAHA